MTDTIADTDYDVASVRSRTRNEKETVLSAYSTPGSLCPEAMSALKAIVGPEHVKTDNESCESHSKDTGTDTKLCAAVVYPSSAAEIQKIVAVASTHKLKIWTFSGGCNWGYGTRNAADNGALILVLSRMNRILEVNEKLGYAVIEPGVTQKQLSSYLREQKLKVMVDVNDASPQASVIGNALERGYGCTVHGDHFAQLCGLEVVLPNGELLRTGGPLLNNQTWNTHKWGCGPYIEGLFSQSNLGIVVKAGVWLLPQPECWRLYTFALAKDDDLPDAIDRLRVLGMQEMVHSNTHMANDIGMLSVVTQYPQEMLNGATYLSDEARQLLQRRFSVAPWTLAGAIYGTHEQVRCRKHAIQRALCPLGKIHFFGPTLSKIVKQYLKLHDWIEGIHPGAAKALDWLRRLVMPESLALVKTLPGEYALHGGTPTECITKMAYFKAKTSIPTSNLDPARDGCGAICHAPAVPATGEHSKRILEIVRPLFRRHGFDLFACFTRMNERTNFFLTMIYFDQTNEEEKARARMLFSELKAATDGAGYQIYRCGVQHYDGFLDPSSSLARFLGDIKRTLDPDDLLAPGRYGMGKSSDGGVK